MKHRLSLIASALAAAMALPHGAALATNGLFMPGYGVRALGMGGVGIAYGRDSQSVGANPANIVNTGMRGDIGFSVLNAESHAATGNGTGVTQRPPDFFANSPYSFDGSVDSDNSYFIMPEMSMTMPLTDKLHVGIAFLPNGGGASRYPENFFSYLGITPSRDTELGIELVQLLAPISVGYKANEDHAFGASLALAAQRFRAFGLQAFQAFDLSASAGVTTITAYPDRITDNGFDYSFGAGLKLGWLGEFFDDRLTLGVVYNSRTYMTKFDKYKGLFAEQGDLDIPESYGIGFAFKPVKNLVIAADVLRVNYSDVASIGNRGPGTHPRGAQMVQSLRGLPSHLDPSKELGNDNGMGFGFRDQTVYKFGIQYGVNNRLLVRAGYNYGKSPIPDDQLTFATLAPAVTEKHYSLGFTYRASDELEITGAYMYVPSNAQENLSRQNIVSAVQVDMRQNVFGLSLGWVLDPGPVSLEEYGDGDWDGINFDGWYGGLGIGQSNYRDIAAASANTRSEGWKVYGGYQFNDYVALEGGYVNLNDMSAVTGAVRTNTATQAWALGGVLSYPVTNKISVMGKFGYAYMRGDTGTKDGAAMTVRTSQNGYEPNYGVGVSYKVFDNLNLRAEWERFDRSNMDIDLITAGMQVKF